MMIWAILFLLVTFIAAMLGALGIAGTAAGLAHTVLIVFAAMFLVAVLIGGPRRV